MVTHFLCDHADLFICLDQHLCRLIDPEAAKIILKGLPILFAEDERLIKKLRNNENCSQNIFC